MSNEADQDKLLARWLSGALSEEEKEQLKNEKGLDDLRFALDDLKGWKVPELDVAAGLNDLRARIDRESAPKQSRQVFFQPWLRIAASIILIAAVYFVFNTLLSSGPTTIATGFGETLSHVLPDGSVVDLDANSSISYSEKAWDDSRELSLTGRALFSVETGNTFQVQTEEGSVTVLGTVFDVKQRAAGTLAVNCYEGRVRVDIRELTELLKGGEGLVSENSQVTRLNVGVEKPDWVEKRSNYNGAALSDVIKDLEEFHGVNITLPAGNNDRFNGMLNYSDLEKALDQLATVFELTFSRDGDKVVFE